MRPIALFLLLALTPFTLSAQNAADQKTPDKDADKKSAATAAPAPKTDAHKDQKKEEPKKDEAKKDEKKPGLNTDTFSGLKFRSIGPAVESGRVMSIAVNPRNKSEYYVGVASSGVWKTVNDGTTWTPLFDGEGSYSIGWVALDPSDPSVVWVGSGESNSQRSVSYGDGIARSDDGGKSWKNMGLKKSEHIGRVVIDPRGVLREFGLQLPDDVEVRVWDSTAELRYLVLPEHPAGTEKMSEEELTALVTRDAMVGVAEVSLTSPAGMP